MSMSKLIAFDADGCGGAARRDMIVHFACGAGDMRAIADMFEVRTLICARMPWEFPIAIRVSDAPL
jgi:hypothetical protein